MGLRVKFKVTVRVRVRVSVRVGVRVKVRVTVRVSARVGVRVRVRTTGCRTNANFSEHREVGPTECRTHDTPPLNRPSCRHHRDNQ